jgi:suppressor of fused-like protein
MVAENDDAAPGWDAIESAFRGLYPGQESPRHYGTGGSELPNSCVWGISAYEAPDHWHLVTFGLSELWAKEGDNPDVSGWGFELTMKVPREQGDEAPPSWAPKLLKIVGDSVYRTGKPLADGSRVDVGAPITMPVISSLQALALTPDPALSAIDTPNGRVEFLQVVGITRKELERMQATSTAAVLEELRAANPELLTDPSR